MLPPAPIPDWSPSSSAEEPLTEDGQVTTKHDSPPRPDGKHDQGDDPDERTGPLVVEDPRPESEPADEKGDATEPGAEKRAVLVAGPSAPSAQFTPSGRQMSFSSDEVFY